MSKFAYLLDIQIKIRDTLQIQTGLVCEIEPCERNSYGDPVENSWALDVGLDRIHFNIGHISDKKGNERLFIRVKTDNTKAKNFKEIRGNGLAWEPIFQHILECLAVEQEAREKERRSYQLKQSALNAIERIHHRKLPTGVCFQLLPNEKGTIDVLLEDITENIVDKILDLLRDVVEEDSKNKGRELWDHLREPEV
jgi:hypothetical protein